MSLILCNAGPLIVLGKLNRLDLLAALYTTVTIPQAVFDEVVTTGLRRGHADARLIYRFWQEQDWPIVAASALALENYHPPVMLDAGERELLTLAQQLSPEFVLMDDELARSEARRLGLNTRGTLGILVQAYRQRLVRYQQIEALISEIAARPDIWISTQLCQRILSTLNPLP